MEEKIRIIYNLQYFAGNSGADKTEEPTAKKLRDAREEGQVAKSNELNIGLSLLVLFLCIKLFVGKIGTSFIQGMHKYFGYIEDWSKETVLVTRFHSLLSDVIVDIILIVLPIFLITYIATFVITLAQVKWQLSTKPLQPKLSKFNPVEGFKKMFSKDKIVDLIKAILKIGITFYVVYSELRDQIGFLGQLYTISLKQAIVLIGDVVINLGLKVSAVFVVIGLADYLYQKRKFHKDMRMTKQEVKDEYKQSEGDPQLKSKIKQKMREVSQRRMMAALPEADVVITNPTHLAVAIKYDKDKGEAPIVIAKGADLLAKKIRETAREHHVEIVENKPLARMLYFNVEIGSEIPKELYQMVAEVLAYVYQLKSK